MENIKEIYDYYFCQTQNGKEVLFEIDKNNKDYINVYQINNTWTSIEKIESRKSQILYNFINGFDGMIMNQNCELMFVKDDWDGWYEVY